MILVEQLSKAYDETLAVDELSFTLDAGQILGLVGPNGAGKTTTLKALAGIIAPSRGRLSVADFDVERQPIQAKHQLAYVPDDPQLFPDLTVAQHLAFSASAYRVDNATAKAARLLEQFELTAKQHTAARNLSRGMRQKLAICCAYLHDPQALMLDEPMTGLDPHGIRTLKRSILQRAEQGSAVIISSHLLAMVEDICSHVLILKQGQRRFLGTLTELKHEYQSDHNTTSFEDIFFQATSTSHDGADCQLVG